MLYQNSSSLAYFRRSSLHRLRIYGCYGVAAGGVYFPHRTPLSMTRTVHVEGRCRHERSIVIVGTITGIFSAIVDFYLALYPAAMLWSLPIYWRKKCTSSEYPTQSGYDFIEANSSIIAACIPMLLPLVKLWLGKDFLSGRPALASLRRWPGSSVKNGTNVNKTASGAESPTARYERDQEGRWGESALLSREYDQRPVDDDLSQLGEQRKRRQSLEKRAVEDPGKSCVPYGTWRNYAGNTGLWATV
ncbi:hypothetical protein EDB81DRAFT_766072 [Dactylonectria macrodidyma]|uniref:Integral membrane protein n=1 Tax=Dactylonectria macrodidyma TaxID=307937 RepID=A0A9P9IJT4_9HYPO|nr:hypothetical protein EDB81DRAFT_766072 [Dactylonectria macrodidyma]